jgi:hypothetical protein
MCRIRLICIRAVPGDFIFKNLDYLIWTPLYVVSSSGLNAVRSFVVEIFAPTPLVMLGVLDPPRLGSKILGNGTVEHGMAAV